MDLVRAWWGSNEFLSGGATLMVIGAVLAYLRRAPLIVWGWLLNQFTVEVDVLGSDPAFGWLRVWLAEHPYSRRARRLSASVRIGVRDAGVDDGPPRPGDRDDVARVILSPAPGTHLLRHGRFWMVLERRRDDAPGARGASGAWRESYHLRLLGRSPEVAQRLLEEVRAAAEKWGRRPGVRVFSREYSGWRLATTQPDRATDSVILPGDTVQTLVDDARRFVASRAWYEGRGVPYRRGYLLHGIPGSGKTSVVLALASALGRPVYDLGLCDPELSESTLISAMRQVEDGGILLIEDADAAPVARARTADVSKDAPTRPAGLNIASLLNAMDGVGAPDGRIVVMTSNHPERLDPALVRPGRIDVQVPFGPATAEQGARLYRRFHPEAPDDWAERFGQAATAAPVSMAALQERLLLGRDDPEGTVRAAEAESAGGSSRLEVA